MSENFKRKEITREVIDTFLNGHDPETGIVNIEYSYKDDFVTVYRRNERDEKEVHTRPFYPFVWARKNVATKLRESAENKAWTVDNYGNSKLYITERYQPKDSNGNPKLKDGKPIHATRKKYVRDFTEYMKEYGIWFRTLDTRDNNGRPVKAMEDGYTIMFYATKPMSQSTFLEFFKFLGYPIYSDKKDADATEKKRSDYMTITPVEQYLVYTGKRFFKGYEDYDDVLRMIFDLETTGLETTKDRIEQIGIRFNRDFKYEGKPTNCETILTTTGETKEEKDKSELNNIIRFLKTIHGYDPDILTGHNIENFDWEMIIGALNRLGTSLEEVSKKYFGGRPIYKSEKEKTLKLGGETEKFFPTIVPGRIVTDSLHAVRRAQAIDSNMLKADLKYVTKYSKFVKPNRVYIPGGQITKIWNDVGGKYGFNDENGSWHIIDNKHPLTEGEVEVNGTYIARRYLLDDLWEGDKVEHRYNTNNFLLCKMLPIPFARCCTMGTAGQWKALMLAWSYENGLALPQLSEKQRFVGGLSRLQCVGFVGNVIKLDFNSLYPSIILTWAITNDKDIMGTMLAFLEYVLTQREKYKGLKKKCGKEADKILEKLKARDYSGRDEGKELNRKMMEFKAEEAANDKKQLPLKIFGNSFFGSYGAPNLFPWGDIDCAERVTCTGRQSLRLMISHFSNLGEKNGLDSSYDYKPIVGDTDGYNFQLPENYRFTKDNPYISPGLSRETKEGVEYVGFKADVAEFNDKFMKDFHYDPLSVNKMGLGIDEVVNSTINFSRKNYADYFPENDYPEDVKLVGNTIKSKKLQGFIAKFLDKGVRLLLQNKGREFLEEYYDYIEKIYNYKIPLRDIASKGKVKKTIPDYIEDCKTITKAGRPKSRQAWMELAVKDNVKVNIGDTLYYINTGKSKSHSDCKKLRKFYKTTQSLFGDEETECTAQIEREYKAYCKENKADTSISDYISKYHKDVRMREEIILNCQLLPVSMVEADEDTFCDSQTKYNVAKYIAQFNSRITPLLVCFSKSIRDKILITNPSDRKYFTEEEAALTSGEPNKESDQDTYEQLMTMDDGEIRFWMNHPEWKIPFLEECGMNWDEIKKDYQERMERERQLGIDKVREAYDEALKSITEDEYNDYVENGKLPRSIDKLVYVDPVTGYFMDRTYTDVKIGSIYDIIEYMELSGEDFEEDE